MPRKNSNVRISSVWMQRDSVSAVRRALNFLSLLAVYGAAPAFAFPDIPLTNEHWQVRENPRVAQVAIFGDDDRRTEEQYARENNMTLAEVQNRYAATGVLTCDRSELTANLTLSNDLIVTSAHGFWGGDCEKLTKPSACTFTIKIGKVTKKARVKGLVAAGYSCPILPAKADDWAILRLETAIEGVQPYAVARDLVEEGASAVHVSAITTDGFKDGVRLPRLTKSIGNCTVHKLYRPYVTRATIFSSDCDFAAGGSGGAVLHESSSGPKLVGVSKGSNERDDQLYNALRVGKAISGPFIERDWAAYHVPLHYEFLEALLKTLK